MRRLGPALLTLAALFLGDGGGRSAAPPPEVGRVNRVLDGDTIEVSFAENVREIVRYIGLDAPEAIPPDVPGGCYGLEAYDYNRRLVEGRTVWLELDRQERDEVGRLWAYVFLDPDRQALVNAILIAQGFVTAAIRPPNVLYAERLWRLHEEARDARRGRWDACAQEADTDPEKARP